MDIRSIKISLERELWIYCRSRWRAVVAVVAFCSHRSAVGWVCVSDCRLLELKLSFFSFISEKRAKEVRKGSKEEEN